MQTLLQASRYSVNEIDSESIAQNALLKPNLDNEIIEAEVIDELLESEQRKLLSYIKENTPLKLLEHKKELKTRDI
ncbi:hypothetical protein Q6T38_001608 [Campylobacter upsaliensis]|nr:hypothetical protein [Campylobacter upsaliensis]EAH7984237.1 hypothetical protein [Campylobacter upsaliensis]EAH8209029.1 hypothetical protein [Campylobacter upsaliensis]EAH9136569.1 hypothetical protein [Campylobacter upsaliensis]EAH9148149.1 hypothetical protein [Campylobacter upsaliensis]EAI0017313.1 hypothetical protein [Campylobacter upsaliensis]